MPLSDEELFLRFKRKNEPEVFRKLVLRYQAYLINMFNRLTCNQQAAEDMAQEVFLRLVKGCKDYSPRARFSTFLYGMARNIWIDYAKKEAFLPKISLEKPIGGDEKRTLKDIIKIAAVTPAEAAAKSDEIELLKRSVRELPPEHQIVVELVVFQERSYEEVADILEIPPGTVRSRMNTAITRLKGILNKQDFNI
jgi:RNA polymerase sigma-70 factor (ECF subfamily)